MSNLVDYARTELQLLGEDEQTTEGVLRIVQAFADMGHSGSSAAAVSHYLDRLLRYQPLTPITNAPAEWNHVGEEVWGEPGGIWQSRRNPEAFSNDGGRTYYLLSERDAAGTLETTPLHTTAHHCGDDTMTINPQDGIDEDPGSRSIPAAGSSPEHAGSVTDAVIEALGEAEGRVRARARKLHQAELSVVSKDARARLYHEAIGCNESAKTVRSLAAELIARPARDPSTVPPPPDLSSRPVAALLAALDESRARVDRSEAAYRHMRELHAAEQRWRDAAEAESARLRGIVEAVENVREQLKVGISDWASNESQYSVGTRDAYGAVGRLLAAALSSPGERADDLDDFLAEQMRDLVTSALPTHLAYISRTVTASYREGMGPELVMRRRVGKVFVEAGELCDAIEGWTGENPRKGQYATREDVIKELIDCASASLCAVEFMTGDKGETLTMLARQVAGNAQRLSAALPDRCADEPAADWCCIGWGGGFGARHDDDCASSSAVDPEVTG